MARIFFADSVGEQKLRKMKRTLSICVAILAIAIAIGFLNHIRPADLQTTDFINFYAAGSVVRHGGGATLYSRQTQDAAFKNAIGFTSTQYFLHPPFEAGWFALLSYLPIQRAFTVWTLVNVALVGLLPLVLKSAVRLILRKPYVATLALAFLPVPTALTLGQDSVLLLFIFSSCYALLRQQRNATAGLALALAAIKFQYLIVLLPLILMSRKSRLLPGFLTGAFCLVCLSVLMVGVKGLQTYFTFLLDFGVHSGYGSINPTLMVNWPGFLQGMGLTRHTAAYSMIGSLLLFALGFRCMRVLSEHSQDLIFAICLTISFAATPYAHFPDAAILLLPMLIVIDHVNFSQHGKLATLTQACCGLLFLWPWLLLALSGHYWWNSRIFLVFPAVLLFLFAAVAALYQENRSVRKFVA